MTIRLLVYGTDDRITEYVSSILCESACFEVKLADRDLGGLVQEQTDNWKWDAVLVCAGPAPVPEIELEMLRQRIGFCPIVVVSDCASENPSPAECLTLPLGDFSPRALQLLLQASAELRAAKSKLACLEATARIKNDILARQNEFVHNLTSRMCHEVRSPLTAARQFASLLSRRQSSDSDVPHLADRVLRNLDELSMLVDDLSSLSHWDVQHRGVRRKPTRVADIVREIVPLLRERARIESVEFEVRLGDSLPKVFADPDALSQVIRNLAVNSLQHAQPRQRVQLWAEQAGEGYVAMGIEDQFGTENEAGMQEAFREFCEAEISLDAGLTGRRRGLAVASRLLEMNLSQLQLESLGDQGSTFVFRLPVAEPTRLIDHFLATLHLRRPRATLSLLTFETQSLGDFLPGPAINDFLQTSSTADDLVFQSGPLTWTALLCGNQHELNGRLRLLDTLWASRRQSDSWLQLPALHWQQQGNWLLESNDNAIATAFLNACGIERRECSNAGRVLVVDNHPERILRLTHQLEAAGYDVVVARDGNEGVSSATQRRPDAIVLDGTSPEADGVSTLQQLRRIDEGTNAAPIIMLAANMRQQQQALEHGAKAIFDGNCHTNTVVQAVRHSLAKTRDAVALVQ